ncbi:putative cytochrome P450 6a14 isoform X1 [Andrena cerasifolii]|uniref:putative cytochrome P450 6a14 isoform X1 n=1 Tax=Andrena cerasifolii TaxID=2819439 RepID=UPI004038074C
MLDYFQILCGTALLLLTVYYYYTSTFHFWKNRGIPAPQPSIIFGNAKKTILMKLSMSEYLKEVYDEYKNEPVVGLYFRATPVLVVNDLDLIKDILIRDFSLFANRGVDTFPKVEPLSEHLFQIEADRWRPLRARLSPVFTSGKLKEMFPLIIECADHLEKYLDKIVEKNEPVECRDLAAKFTTDVIGSCAFGIDTNALSDEDSEFRRMGRKIFMPSARQLIRDTCRQFFPYVYKIFGHLVQPTDINEFFTKLVVDTMDYRVKHNVLRPDFVNLLMEIKKNPHNLENIELTDSLLTAQAFLFFVAGFETSSSTIGHTLYEMAQNPHIQDKLRQEIRETCTKNGGVLMYEQLKEMKYLDKVFRETLRKYPILPMLMRQAAVDYTFKGTKISIPKDTRVWIPAYAIHQNPDIYPNPDIFDPERFNDDVFSARHPMSYLPFGDGPRNCVGARFANIQSKIGLITILRHHRVEVCEKTTIPYQHDKRAFLLTLKGGILLKITKVAPMAS